MGLAWKRVAREVAEGTLGGEFERSDRAELQSKVRRASRRSYGKSCRSSGSPKSLGLIEAA